MRLMDDFEAIHENRLVRRRHHGSCSLHSAQITATEMQWAKNGMGLGFFDGETLTHHLWLSREATEFGPFRVAWMVYRSPRQLLDLLGVIGSLGEQVRLVSVFEPPEVQLQDLISKPLKHLQISKKSPLEAGIHAHAFWQARILDLESTLSKTHLPSGDLEMNLVLFDPIVKHLPEDAPWRGVTGIYTVHLGTSCGAVPGLRPELPTLTASVGAWTRTWLGVRPASGLAITDSLSAPKILLDQLDDIFRVPAPRIDWEL